jgi:hypothetical protein
VFGRVYHPYFTRRIPLLGVCSEMYAGFDLSIPLHLGLASDESLESDDWMANDPQLEAAINWVVGLGATLDDENSGYSLNVSGSASITAKAFLEYKSPARQLVAYAKLFPVVMKINASVDSESNMGDSEPLFQLISEEIVLFKEFSSPTITLHTFTE